MRFTYNEAFQAPNYAELFLQTDAAPPVNLSALNAVCAPFGVNCGFGMTRVLAVGNKDLALERITTWEVGYKGLLAGRALLTLDYYNSDSSNFVTDLLPQLGTALGRVNPNFGPWQPPPGLPAQAAALVRTLAPRFFPTTWTGRTFWPRSVHQLRQGQYPGCGFGSRLLLLARLAFRLHLFLV